MTIDEKIKNLLNLWIATDNGQELYRFTGPYWEVLYPLMEQHAPKELGQYENIAGPFEVFNEDIKKKYESGNEDTDFRNTINYMNGRLYSTSSTDVHLIDMGYDNIIAYLPNQEIDQKGYWGREN
ncbi:MAG TPA: hypothetical protein VHO03_16855 [Ignavibacteriales bacterium]|nr:hypothetical protein [Ignavibacteriales bacterium]